MLQIPCLAIESALHYPGTSSTRAQGPVESAHPIHVLPILRLLLLPHTIDVISRDFFILGALERDEAHHFLHHLNFRVRVHLHRCRVGAGSRRAVIILSVSGDGDFCRIG